LAKKTYFSCKKHGFDLDQNRLATEAEGIHYQVRGNEGVTVGSFGN